MRSTWLAAALAVGCSSSWQTPDDLSPARPDAPSTLAACAAGGAAADGEVSAVLCTASSSLLTGPVGDGTVALEPGPVPLLDP